MEKVMMKGNEAVAEGALKAGCRFFFGYPITPQNEVPEYMARRMPEVGGTFLQAESEVSAINMVFGAGGAGARVMTSSSSPGISLKQEGISYIAGAEVPCLVVNVMRGGPGLGGLDPSQADYFQATKGGGHGDYRLIVLAPASVQEMYDFASLAFDLADQYRNPVMILTDAIIGQMMEPVVMKDGKSASDLPVKTWAASGKKDRPANLISSVGIPSNLMEEINLRLKEKYQKISRQEVRFEKCYTDEDEIIVVAYGTTSRIAKSAISKARKAGIKVGLLRPITLWPFPSGEIDRLAGMGKKFLAAEISNGQMVEDVRLAVNGRAQVRFYGKVAGTLPTVPELYEAIKGF
ncbi:MAG: 3-methyl-2-oxobutanoate dehydrogenase subunit VorB [Bacillota bacterium]